MKGFFSQDEEDTGQQASTGDAIKGVLRIEKAKRKLAARLGVDIYSRNPDLQQELDRVASPMAGGGLALNIGTMPIGGAVGMSLTAIGVNQTVENLINDSSADDLRKWNEQKLGFEVQWNGNRVKRECCRAQRKMRPPRELTDELPSRPVTIVANRPIVLKNSVTVDLARFLGVALPLTDARERLVGRSERPNFLRAVRERRATSFSTLSAIYGHWLALPCGHPSGRLRPDNGPARGAPI